MPDREKIIGLLSEIAEYFRECRSNASFASKAENHFWELQNAAGEAAALLKEQKAVEPTPLANRRYACGNCGNSLWVSGQRFCASCGRAVKWNE